MQTHLMLCLLIASIKASPFWRCGCRCNLRVWGAYHRSRCNGCGKRDEFSDWWFRAYSNFDLLGFLRPFVNLLGYGYTIFPFRLQLQNIVDANSQYFNTLIMCQTITPINLKLGNSLYCEYISNDNSRDTTG